MTEKGFRGISILQYESSSKNSWIHKIESGIFGYIVTLYNGNFNKYKLAYRVIVFNGENCNTKVVYDFLLTRLKRNQLKPFKEKIY